MARGKQHGGERALHSTVIGRELRLLGRALARVPPGRMLDRMAQDHRKVWDANTGLFLLRKGEPRPKTTVDDLMIAGLNRLEEGS